jgi:hypothetical protein
MRKADGKWLGHTWVEVDGQPCGEAPAGLDEFAIVLVFNADGTAEVASRWASPGRVTRPRAALNTAPSK